MPEKFKSLAQNDQVFYGLLLVLVALCSFGLGRAAIPATGVPTEAAVGFAVSKMSREGSLTVSLPLAPGGTSAADPASVVAGSVVASKTGKKYHLPSCPGAKQIKSSNLISFNSAAEAKAAGYTPAANCPGLK